MKSNKNYKYLINKLRELNSIKASDNVRERIILMTQQVNKHNMSLSTFMTNSFAQIIFFLFVILTLGSGVSALAAEHSKPGTFFYPFKKVVDNVESSIGILKPEEKTEQSQTPSPTITPTTSPTPSNQPSDLIVPGTSSHEENIEDDNLKESTQSARGKEDDGDPGEHGIDEVLKNNPQINLNDVVNGVLGVSTQINKEQQTDNTKSGNSQNSDNADDNSKNKDNESIHESF